MLISLPQGGVLVLGEMSITYHSGVSFKTITVDFSCFKAFGKVDRLLNLSARLCTVVFGA